jgi:hypothetical protein
MASLVNCKACEKPFEPSNWKHVYCSYRCREGDPAVYRFAAPRWPQLRRSRARYPQSRQVRHSAFQFAIARCILEQYPPETFTFEVLERLPHRHSSWQEASRELREAEQRHIDRLHSYDPAMGFNMVTALSRRYRAAPVA